MSSSPEHPWAPAGPRDSESGRPAGLMRDALLTAAGACLVALLNEIRAQLRAREANRDRAEQLQRAARRESNIRSIDDLG